MFKQTIVAALAAILPSVSAIQCQNLTIPVSISARNGVFSLANPTNNIASTNFALHMARQGGNYSAQVLTGYATVSGKYEISASYCEPDNGPGSVLQFLTHGIGFDKSYWNFPYANYNYSYVYQAVAAGYSTFAIDRLGIGQSTHFTDPVNEGQIWIEVAAIRYLTEAIRAGSISIAKPDKIVHVGHSFGSASTYTLVAATPDISDGIILTGFSQNATFASQFILGSNLIIANQVSALSSYTTGYLADNSVVGVQIDFFAPDSFDPEVLMLAYETGQPVTSGEILTLGGLTGATSPFKGPVLVITGEHDTPYCGGDCYATGTSLSSIPAASKMFFPNAANFEAFIVPGTGHGLNLAYSYPTTYSTMLNFLASNGLRASSGSSSSSSSSGSSGSSSVASAPAASGTWSGWNGKA